MSVFTGTKWPEPLIYRGLKVFVPVYGNRGQIVPNICFHGDKMAGTVDIQDFERICPLKAADILFPVSEMGQSNKTLNLHGFGTLFPFLTAGIIWSFLRKKW